MDDTSVVLERISTSRPVTPAIARQDPAGNRRAKRKEICLGELVDHFGKQGAENLKERNRRYFTSELAGDGLPFGRATASAFASARRRGNQAGLAHM